MNKFENGEKNSRTNCDVYKIVKNHKKYCETEHQRFYSYLKRGGGAAQIDEFTTGIHTTTPPITPYPPTTPSASCHPVQTHIVNLRGDFTPNNIS